MSFLQLSFNINANDFSFFSVYMFKVHCDGMGYQGPNRNNLTVVLAQATNNRGLGFFCSGTNYPRVGMN